MARPTQPLDLGPHLRQALTDAPAAPRYDPPRDTPALVAEAQDAAAVLGPDSYCARQAALATEALRRDYTWPLARLWALDALACARAAGWKGLTHKAA